jgi:GNAT superfamily N-acetyltransferase
MPDIQIIDASRGPELEQCRDLIREYGQSIADVAACSLEHQRFDEELAGLPGRYAPPRGRLLMAMADGQPAGCIAMRPLDKVGIGVCEMKRLYVRPTVRGGGLGRLLVERLLDEARREGYRVMKLDTDTHPKFHAAIALYRGVGFVECERYNADPDPKTLWFERRL